jgi:hypothetical protein
LAVSDRPRAGLVALALCSEDLLPAAQQVQRERPVVFLSLQYRSQETTRANIVPNLFSRINRAARELDYATQQHHDMRIRPNP